MTTHIGQDCLLQRRAKIPHSSQNTAGFCSPPPTGAGFSPPALSVSVNQSIPHPQAAPAAGPCANHAVIHSSGLGTHLPTVTPSRCWGHSRSRSQGCAHSPCLTGTGSRNPELEGGREGRGAGEKAEQGWHNLQKTSRSGNKFPAGLSLQWPWLFHAAPAQFQFYFSLHFKSLTSQTSWSFMCSLGFVYMHGHTQAQV